MLAHLKSNIGTTNLAKAFVTRSVKERARLLKTRKFYFKLLLWLCAIFFCSLMIILLLLLLLLLCCIVGSVVVVVVVCIYLWKISYFNKMSEQNIWNWLWGLNEADVFTSLAFHVKIPRRIQKRVLFQTNIQIRIPYAIYSSNKAVFFVVLKI